MSQKNQDNISQKKTKLEFHQYKQALDKKMEEAFSTQEAKEALQKAKEAQEVLEQIEKKAKDKFDEEYQFQVSMENFDDKGEQNPHFIKDNLSSIAKIESFNNSKDFKSIGILLDNNEQFSVETVNKTQEKSLNHMSLELPKENQNILEKNQITSISTNSKKRKANQQGNEHLQNFDEKDSDEKNN
ncbi:hypothetical protein ABPG72_010129 [Tetrahymena utriculariae]